MPKRPLLGDQQLDVLRFVTENEPITVSEVAKRYGGPRGLARTTLLTVMEALRGKGYLTREREDGTFRYRARIGTTEVLRVVVRDFVDRTLGGSASPFVAYLEENPVLSRSEIDRLRVLVDRLDGKDKEGTS